MAPVPTLLLDEPAEEAVGFPLRAAIGVGNTQRQFFEDGVELHGGREVDWLAQVIRRRVVAFCIPGPKDFLFRRAGNVAELECQRRNPFLMKLY